MPAVRTVHVLCIYHIRLSMRKFRSHAFKKYFIFFIKNKSLRAKNNLIYSINKKLILKIAFGFFRSFADFCQKMSVLRAANWREYLTMSFY